MSRVGFFKFIKQNRRIVTKLMFTSVYTVLAGATYYQFEKLSRQSPQEIARQRDELEDMLDQGLANLADKFFEVTRGKAVENRAMKDKDKTKVNVTDKPPVGTTPSSNNKPGEK